MIFREVLPIAAASLPLEPFRAHLRLGSGFGDEALQDAALEPVVRAALAAIEARIGKALLTRSFVGQLQSWQSPLRQPLSLAPVLSLDSLVLTDAEGQDSPIDPGLYRLLADPHSPQIVPTTSRLPVIPSGGTVAIELTAGMAQSWEETPPDLAQAVLRLAAHYYDHRADARGSMVRLPFGVSELLAPYRRLRLSGEVRG